MSTWTADPRRLLYLLSAAFLLSAAAHLVVFLVDGSPWAGPVSWRKPIQFAFSFGLTTATLAWILGRLPRRRRAQWLLAAVYAVASIGEVALITLQTWRGVPSHFNFAGGFDSAVFSVMGALIIVVGLATAVVLMWSLGAPSREAPSVMVAIRAGLAFLVLGQLVGVGLLAQGMAVATASSFTTVPPLGSLALPHAIALHGVQVLPALALLASRTHVLERDRMRIVALGAVGYSVVVAAAVASGLSASAGAGGLAAIGIGLAGALILGGAGAAALLPLRRTLAA